MKVIIILLILGIFILDVNAQCSNPIFVPQPIIQTDAQIGRDKDNTSNVARTCKGNQTKFWCPNPSLSVIAWWVFEDNVILLKDQVNDTLELDNITGTDSTLWIKLVVQNSAGTCYEYRLSYEVLETSMSATYTNLNGTFVVSNIPLHYSVNINSIPNGINYSNGYLYDNGSLIFQLPNGTYKIMYSYQNHVWMNAPQCAPNLVYDTISITNSTVGVSYIEDDPNIKAYPNPACEYIQLKIQNKVESISIYNQLGKEVMNIGEYSSDELINIQHLSCGIYVMIIKNADEKLVRKRFIKQ